jgi:hypothetical protein
MFPKYTAPEKLINNLFQHERCMLISIFVYTRHSNEIYNFNIPSGAAINFDSGPNVMLVGSGALSCGVV